MNDMRPGTLPALSLAYIGDSVYELEVRRYLLSEAARKPGDYNKLAFGIVCASSQSAHAERIMPLLTEEELAVYKQGRNAKSGAAPKSATPAQYRSATGLEALFGYLYLSGRGERINELFLSGVKESGETADAGETDGTDDSEKGNAQKD